MPDTTWIAAATIVTLILLLASYLVYSNSTSRVGGVDMTILLMGPSNSGKSLLLSTLYVQSQSTSTEESSRKRLETCMSVESSSCIVPLSCTAQAQKQVKKALLVDLPGHPRLSWKLDEWKSNASFIFFLVDAQCPSAHLKKAAESLYSILTNQVVVKRKVPLKIICTKTDLDAAKSVEEVCRLLEAEMEGLRASKANDMLDQQDAQDQEYLGYEGEVFSFDHVVNPITWTRLSLVNEKIDLMSLVG